MADTDFVGINEDRYVQLIADLINRDPVPRERERRVREANRDLYQLAVAPESTIAQADLVLVRAAQKERIGA